MEGICLRPSQNQLRTKLGNGRQQANNQSLQAIEDQRGIYDHSHLSLKSNSLIAMPKAWKRLKGWPNSSAKVLSSIFPKTMVLGAFSSCQMENLSQISMKFLIEACLTLPPKLSAQDLSLSFHLGCLLRRRMAMPPWKSLSDSSSENLNMSKSSQDWILGTTALSFLGPFMPKKLLSYSMQAMVTLNLDRSQSWLGCMPLSQRWQAEPAALPLSLPRQAGLLLSISLVKLKQQLQPMQPRWFSQKKMGRWSYPITWQYSLKPLWCRLKQTKECRYFSKGMQMAILRYYLFDPALFIRVCMCTQVQALGVFIRSYFIFRDYCFDSSDYYSFVQGFWSLECPCCCFSGDGSSISSSSSSSAWLVDSAGFLVSKGCQLRSKAECSKADCPEGYSSESNFFTSRLPLCLRCFLPCASISFLCSASASRISDSPMVWSSSKSTKAFWLACEVCWNTFCWSW